MGKMPAIEDFADNFDPFTALYTSGGEGGITTPCEDLSALGKIGPVAEKDLYAHFGLPTPDSVKDIEKAYMTLTFAACQEVLNKPEVFSSAVNERRLVPIFGKSLTFMDAPEHTKYRHLFQAGFMPTAINAYRARFERIIAELIDGLRQHGRTTADLVQNFALRFPFSFICSLMDLPVADRGIFHKLAAGQNAMVFDRKYAVEASEKLTRYLIPLIEERRKLKSETDFVSLLANAEVEGERLPEDILLGFFRQLMNASGDTRYLSFSTILAALFTRPAQLEKLRENRDFISRAIEEGLRWGAPVTSGDRITTRDTALCGVPIKKGAIVRVCIGAANRDESVWPNPHEFDIERELKRNYSFSGGAHICLGQHLARMKLQYSLSALLDNLPNVRLDPDMPSPTIRGLTFRGADAVHVKWDT